ncbi:CREB/ATF bZIP transcription factor [Anoplopoma fimbria]|uniref:CREB/ATF bZIP transcription factor n=1 Tax=Anoplopoma fimbria TaxID=229290 RepID=UPI0023EB72F7|nr:CREB/ATF bZIP transcription factor [Anoplopoma fimbria]
MRYSGQLPLQSSCQTTMITRRRRTMNNTRVQPLEVEVLETVEDLSSPSEGFPSDDMDTAGIELDDLFGIEDLKWTLERDTSSSSLFDIELADLGLSAKDEDSEVEASTASSPDRMLSESRIKKRQSQSSHMINKNAIAARMNRLRKKEYVNSLEKKVGILSTENNVLRQENSQLTKRVEELEDETRYLRAVLANESMLAQLLSRLSGVNGMKLSSSLFQGPDSNEHDYALPRKRVKVEEKETAGGVCLHVDKDHVSVEFCTKCAESASTSLKIFF